MIGFKRRPGFIQYLPKKPKKWGMKAFVLADSITRYTYKWRHALGFWEILQDCGSFLCQGFIEVLFQEGEYWLRWLPCIFGGDSWVELH